MNKEKMFRWLGYLTIILIGWVTQGLGIKLDNWRSYLLLISIVSYGFFRYLSGLNSKNIPKCNH